MIKKIIALSLILLLSSGFTVLVDDSELKRGQTHQIKIFTIHEDSQALLEIYDNNNNLLETISRSQNNSDHFSFDYTVPTNLKSDIIKVKATLKTDTMEGVTEKNFAVEKLNWFEKVKQWLKTYISL